MQHLLIIIFILFSGCSNKNAQTSSSVWVWDATAIHHDNMVETLTSSKINRIFLNVGYQPLKNGGGEFYLQEHPSDYDSFLKKAKENKVEVEALYGSYEWALKQYLQNFKKEVNDVLDFNATHVHRFDSLHLDIEPHQLDYWEENGHIGKQKILKEFLHNLKEVREMIDSHNIKNDDHLRLVVDISDFIANYRIDETPFIYHLFPLIDEICLMNYTQDPYLFIERGTRILKIADEFDKKVSIGIELQVIEDEEIMSITLGNFRKEEFDEYLYSAEKIFNKYKSFKQISIHSFEAYKVYLEKNMK